jgi:hypothetical protein
MSTSTSTSTSTSLSLSDTDAAVQNGVSRIETLRTLLAKHGAPGSRGCRQGAGDLTPIIRDGDVDVDVEPELVQVLGGEHELMLDLHPHLFPLARSQSTGNYVCALRRAFANDADYESSSMAPWPIVESKINAPGMRLLSLNRYVHHVSYDILHAT